jgi:hypothetical protein
MREIRAEIEQTYRLTVEGDDAQVVLYDAKRKPLVGGLVHWQGRFDDDGATSDGHIVTLDDGSAGFFGDLGFILAGRVNGKGIVAASRRITEILGRAGHEPAVVSGIIPVLEELLGRLKAYGDSPAPGGAVIAHLISRAEAIAAPTDGKK